MYIHVMSLFWLTMYVYLTVSHTHPKPRNKPIKTLVARQHQPNILYMCHTCTCTPGN